MREKLYIVEKKIKRFYAQFVQNFHTRIPVNVLRDKCAFKFVLFRKAWVIIILIQEYCSTTYYGIDLYE